MRSHDLAQDSGCVCLNDVPPPSATRDGDDDDDWIAPLTFTKRKRHEISITNSDLTPALGMSWDEAGGIHHSENTNRQSGGRRSRSVSSSFDWFGQGNEISGRAFVNLGGVGGSKVEQKRLSGWTLQLTAQIEEEENEGASTTSPSFVLPPAAIATKEIEADGYKAIWNQTFQIDVPSTMQPVVLRVDLHARVNGRLARIASARAPLAEMLGNVTGSAMHSVALRRFSLSEIDADWARLLGESSSDDLDDPYFGDGKEEPGPAPAPISRKASLPLSSSIPGRLTSPSRSLSKLGFRGGEFSQSLFVACASLPDVIEVGVAAAKNPKRILPVEVSDCNERSHERNLFGSLPCWSSDDGRDVACDLCSQRVTAPRNPATSHADRLSSRRVSPCRDHPSPPFSTHAPRRSGTSSRSRSMSSCG